MSKVEVKVKAGDEWDVFAEELYQIRGEKERVVASNNKVYAGEWGDLSDVSGGSLPASVARAWIESLGGTVVEEREEAVPTLPTHAVVWHGGGVAFLGSEDECKRFDFNPIAAKVAPLASLVAWTQGESESALYVYKHTNGKVRFYTKMQINLTDWTYLGTTTITIAGVTT